MDRERIPLAVDDPVDGTAALATEGVDVVVHLAGRDRRDAARGVPLGAVRLVARVPRDVADRRVDVDDEITLGERSDVAQEIGRPARPPMRVDEPVAEDVLLADDRGRIGLEAGLEAEDGKADILAGERLGSTPSRPPASAG